MAKTRIYDFIIGPETGTLPTAGTPSNASDVATKGYVDTALAGYEPDFTAGSISTSTTGVTVGSGSNSTVGPNVTVNIQTASGSQPGLLSAADWTTFNAGGGLTAAQSGNKFLASPANGSSGTPAYRAIVAADIPTLNQNTTGSAASFTGSLVGDVGGTQGATAIGANKVTLSMMATVATATFLGRTTASTGNVEALTVTQATALLNAFVGDSGSGGTKGLVPAPASGDAVAAKFLKADGTWASLVSAAPTIFGSRGTPRSVVAATGITSGATHMSTTAINQDIYVEGSITGDSVAATITAGTSDGQRMTLIGRTDTKTVSLDDTTTNISIRGSITLGADEILNLRFDGTKWVETSRNN